MNTRKMFTMAVAVLAICALSVPAAFAQPVPGGTLDPLTIPKYVTPLVIPPVMNNTGTPNDYDIAVREFQQQILPGGLWANPAVSPACAADPGCNKPATTVWSYGPDVDPTPVTAPDPNSQFNYPAYTIETISNTTNDPANYITVDWINDLVADPDACKASATPATDPACNYISHLLPIDRTLHWANPELLPCMDGTIRTDCRPAPANGAILQQPYLGPVPIVTHVHGAHVNPNSDGYPEAWWLPRANNIPGTYATVGTLVNQYDTPTNTAPGIGSFTYRNDQPSATIWYHDHTLGMTRNNVYAGPAGFWLIREAGGGETGLVSGTLPGPAPVANDTVLELNAPNLVPGTTDKRSSIREIPIVIQDRSFNADGSLFYPADRAFFEGVPPADLQIDFIPVGGSDISPIWNPEAFFNVMVVNGVSWPVLEVAPALYRFRLLNGSNSRFLNLSMNRLNKKGKPNKEIPFYQIGAEQSLLPQVVEIRTGKATPLVPGVANWARINAPFKDQALLMGLAERADVLVDFRGLKNGDIVRMFNTAPDAPFGGFPDIPADPATTGQVMQFRVNTALLGASPTDPGGTTPATDPWNLVISQPDTGDPASVVDPPGTPGQRDLALLEEESAVVCVTVNAAGVITQDLNAVPDGLGNCVLIADPTVLAASLPFAPKAAVLGINGSTTPTVTLWSDPIETNPTLDATETWELWNWTMDGHPIHLHLVKFQVQDRQVFGGAARPPQPTEAGWKDTVIAYPGEVTRLKATFDIAGLYVWHCHIVEHEDNEMMVPYCVGDKATAPGCNIVP